MSGSNEKGKPVHERIERLRVRLEKAQSFQNASLVAVLKGILDLLEDELRDEP